MFYVLATDAAEARIFSVDQETVQNSATQARVAGAPEPLAQQAFGGSTSKNSSLAAGNGPKCAMAGAAVG
jgi:hypothetical protein